MGVALTLTLKLRVRPRLNERLLLELTRTAPRRRRIVTWPAPAAGRPATRNVRLLTNPSVAASAPAVALPPLPRRDLTNLRLPLSETRSSFMVTASGCLVAVTVRLGRELVARFSEAFTAGPQPSTVVSSFVSALCLPFQP